MTESTILPRACATRPSRASSNVCRLNDEKVVNPPQTPTMTKARISTGTEKRPPLAVKVPKKPMMNEP